MKLKSSYFLIFGVIILGLLPFFIGSESNFSGTDNLAQAAIKTTDPSYHPWFQPLVGTLGRETETLLFSLQAAAGAGIIGYIFGFFQGKKKQKEQEHD